MYVYLFATVPGSLSLELGFLSEHPVLGSVIALGGITLIVLVVRYFRRRATKLRDELKSGGAVLGQPRRFIVGVVLPEVASFTARLGIVAVFLAAFSPGPAPTSGEHHDDSRVFAVRRRRPMGARPRAVSRSRRSSDPTVLQADDVHKLLVRRP